MRRFVFLTMCGLLFAGESGATVKERQVAAKDRTSLKSAEWFPYVISKLAPLEWWSYEESISDVKRENYHSDASYELARQNTWEFPRFCFSMFRPSLESYVALLNAMKEYDGGTNWWMHDNCIGALREKPTFTGMRVLPKTISDGEIERHNESLRRPPDPAFVEKAVADIPVLCSYLEKRLSLTERTPQEFDATWLTAEGLARSKGESEDFLDPGIWSVSLAREPDAYGKTFKPTSVVDRGLSMGLGMGEQEELFQELGATWGSDGNVAREGPVIPDFPLLSRLDDVTSDTIYEPDEIGAFLHELLRAQKMAKGERSIRGLDKLIRITRWAQKLDVGIYFGGV